MAEVHTLNIPLNKSRLNTLARSTTLLADLVPNISIQMAMEMEMKETHPRAEGDESSRIFIVYTNDRGNNLIFRIDDNERMNREFNIDHFLHGYCEATKDDSIELDEVTQMSFHILGALTQAMAISLDIADGRMTPEVKSLSDNVLKSILSVLYDDSNDVMIMLRDKTIASNGEKTVDIYAMWSMSKQ